MSRYDNDPRVRKVSDTRYELPSPQGWAVEHHPAAGEWRAVAENEDYHHPPYWAAPTVDEAIRRIIGDPVDSAGESAYDSATTGGK